MLVPGTTTTWRRYVALGDSFTEGLSDPDPARPGHYRGWADRLAEHLAAVAPDDVEYANLAVRGRLLPEVVDEQVPVALGAQPDLVSLIAGGNDLLRPGGDPDAIAAVLEDAVVRIRATGADVLLGTGTDPRKTPVIRLIRGKVAVFNAHIWSIASRHGAAVLDQWGAAWLRDPRMWDTDRIHLTAEGHRRVALLAADALGVEVADGGDWRTPLPAQPARPLRAAVAEDAAWVRGFVAPWVAAGCAGIPPATGGRRSGRCPWRSSGAEPAGDSTGRRPKEPPMSRPPFPPFTHETALQKVQAAEDAWNTCDPVRVAQAYTEDTVWRNRDEFVEGRDAVVAFLTRKWERELDYALRKQLWAFTEDRIAVRFQYESRDASGRWWRSHGNELWEFTGEGLMRRREASINDVPIQESERRIHGPRQPGDRTELPLR